jgi:hypothetical protein
MTVTGRGFPLHTHRRSTRRLEKETPVSRVSLQPRTLTTWRYKYNLCFLAIRYFNLSRTLRHIAPTASAVVIEFVAPLATCPELLHNLSKLPESAYPCGLPCLWRLFLQRCGTIGSPEESGLRIILARYISDRVNGTWISSCTGLLFEKVRLLLRIAAAVAHAATSWFTDCCLQAIKSRAGHCYGPSAALFRDMQAGPDLGSRWFWGRYSVALPLSGWDEYFHRRVVPNERNLLAAALVPITLFLSFSMLFRLNNVLSVPAYSII